MKDILEQARSLFEYTRSQRRDFHQNPELGFEEIRTAKIIASEIEHIGDIALTTGIAQTGLVGLLQGDHPGKTVMLRFDMDALPMQEESDVLYRSIVPKKMHACGHDGHLAIGLAVAKILKTHKSEMKGNVKFVFQPAEEGLNGAKRMLDEGVFDDKIPDVALGIHVWNEHPVGWFGISPGPIMAGCYLFEAKIHGVGGHGAFPHVVRDPVVAAAQIITTLQTVISRNVSPIEAGVISVTQITAGDAFNIIPSEVLLRGTMRYFKADVFAVMQKRLEEIVHGISQTMGCTAKISFTDLSKPLINDPAISQMVQRSIQQVIPDCIIDTAYQTMGAEDMALFLERIPGCYFFIGSAKKPPAETYSHHNPRFDFDEEALVFGSAALAASTLAILNA